MRTALLSANRRTDAGTLRAALEAGGRSVLAWQVDWVRELGCERVICLCEQADETVLAVQREVENAGGEFLVIRNNHQLVSLVRAEGDLVMVLDGLVADRSLTDLWSNGGAVHGRGIATVPAGHRLAEAHPDDFERIDRERNWAGIAVIKAAQVHKIADFPPDSEPVSLLLRLALQAQTACIELDEDKAGETALLLATSPQALARREQALIAGAAEGADWAGPGNALAGNVVRRLAPGGLASGAEISGASSLAMLLGGVGLAAAGYGAAALGLAAAGAFAASLSRAWVGLRSALWSKRPAWFARRGGAILLDVLVTLILLLSSDLSLDSGISAQAAATALPVLAIGLSHHLGFNGGKRSAAFWRDRPVHAILFATGAYLGQLPAVLAGFALLALAQLLLSRDRL